MARQPTESPIAWPEGADIAARIGQKAGVMYFSGGLPECPKARRQLCNKLKVRNANAKRVPGQTGQ